MCVYVCMYYVCTMNVFMYASIFLSIYLSTGHFSISMPKNTGAAQCWLGSVCPEVGVGGGAGRMYALT